MGKEDLSEDLRRTLKGYAVSAGPFEKIGNITTCAREHKDWVASNSAHLDIPATHQIPTASPTFREQVNIVKTDVYTHLKEGEVAFNPVHEYERSMKLSEMGLLDAEPQQGTNMVKFSLNKAGAAKLGKILVKDDI